ncbi:hypothetical protein K501DRAFT_284294 [Backusella circina FSU 941]|nr:hypothetical protein K501DRAFT_284294 [Backusella circina FSU 941]
MAARMRMKAIFDCSADEPGELTFKEGDILVDVVKSAEEGWYEGKLENSSERGLFPHNYVEQIPEKVDTSSKVNTPKTEEIQLEPLNNFPTIDAFEAAMSQTRKSTSSNNSSSTQTHKLKQPVEIATMNLLPISVKKEEPIGLGIKLKPTGLRQDIVSRSRSYSTPSTPNTLSSQDNSEKTVRPSQLRKDQGIQSTLSAALSKGPVSSSSPSVFKPMSKPESNSVPLVGLSIVKSIVTKGSDTEDDEKLVKPSQLRNRNQFNKIETRAFPTLPSQSPSPSWKKNSPTTTTRNSSDDALDAKKIVVPEPNNSMPRLPSRPMSAAARKSRSSRTSTNSSHSISTSAASSTKAISESPKTTPSHLSPAKLENEKSAPPALKPKPNVAQPFLPPRPKLRSTSNPPPLQPKPLTTPLDKPVKKTIPVVEVKPSISNTTPPPIAVKPTLKQSGGNTKTPPSIGSQKPLLPSRPSLDSSRRSTDYNSNTASDNDSENSNNNIKPSQLFNRARSATSPSSPGKPMDWNTSPIAPNSETQKKKKATPPPPPPSRQPKNYANNNTNNNNGHLQMDSASKARYEMLFDTINDDGFVDGETTQIIWRKSKLSDEDLACVWKECDPDHKGLLDKESFIEGMGKIDAILSKQQHVL